MWRPAIFHGASLNQKYVQISTKCVLNEMLNIWLIYPVWRHHVLLRLGLKETAISIHDNNCFHLSHISERLLFFSKFNLLQPPKTVWTDVFNYHNLCSNVQSYRTCDFKEQSVDTVCLYKHSLWKPAKDCHFWLK